VDLVLRQLSGGWGCCPGTLRNNGNSVGYLPVIFVSKDALLDIHYHYYLCLNARLQLAGNL